jgi:hypothetical protein
MTDEQDRGHDEAVRIVMTLYGATMFAYGKASNGPEPLKKTMRDLARRAATDALAALQVNEPTNDDVISIVDALELRT